MRPIKLGWEFQAVSFVASSHTPSVFPKPQAFLAFSPEPALEEFKKSQGIASGLAMRFRNELMLKFRDVAPQQERTPS